MLYNLLQGRNLTTEGRDINDRLPNLVSNASNSWIDSKTPTRNNREKQKVTAPAKVWLL